MWSNKNIIFLSLSLLTMLSLCLMAGCKKEVYSDTLSYQYEYQPLTVGQYTIFDVDSYKYSYAAPIQTVDTIRYQQMEKITDTLYDNQNRLNYRVEIFRRPTPAGQWGLWKVWYCVKTTTNYERQEDDLRFTKFVFPPKDDLTWKGNSYLPATDTNFFAVYKDWDYSLKKVGMPLSINGLSFDSTATVVQVDEENLIKKKRSIEIFAKHVGMISKEFQVLEKQDVASSWDAPNKATGFRLVMKVNSYGP